MTESIRMVFYPTPRQDDAEELLDMSPMSVEGRIVGLPGNTIRIRADEVWVQSIPSRSLARNRYETVFEGEPLDLKIFTGGRRTHKRQRFSQTYINYVLYPSPRHLSPRSIHRYTTEGAIKVKTVWRFSFTLRGSRRITFENRYHHERRDDEEVTWHELVAKEKRTMAMRAFSDVEEYGLDDIDDFLLLVTFAARYRVACVGIDAYTATADRFQFYRKNLTVPEVTKHNPNATVINETDFRAFIRKAYRSYAPSDGKRPDELLTHALHLVSPNRDGTVESNFTTLYAALETLVLWHRRGTELEWIVPDQQQWDRFRSDLEGWIKKYDLLKNDASKRKLMYEKVGELRRVGFATAFQSFCTTYGVDVGDLWPVIGPAKQMPLSEIRNHIVHGSVLSRTQLLALGLAEDHLRYVVERMLLGIFGWSVEQSNVRPSYITKLHGRSLPRARRAMQQLPELPDIEADAEI